MDQTTTGTIDWKEEEYKYYGKYTGGLKGGKPHGKGDFVQEGGKKHLTGEWVNGVKQGPFVRLYGNGFWWEGNTTWTVYEKASGCTSMQVPILLPTHTTTIKVFGAAE